MSENKGRYYCTVKADRWRTDKADIKKNRLVALSSFFSYFEMVLSISKSDMSTDYVAHVSLEYLKRQLSNKGEVRTVIMTRITALYKRLQ